MMIHPPAATRQNRADGRRLRSQVFLLLPLGLLAAEQAFVEGQAGFRHAAGFRFNAVVAQPFLIGDREGAGIVRVAVQVKLLRERLSQHWNVANEEPFGMFGFVTHICG